MKSNNKLEIPKSKFNYDDIVLAPRWIKFKARRHEYVIAEIVDKRFNWNYAQKHDDKEWVYKLKKGFRVWEESEFRLKLLAPEER